MNNDPILWNKSFPWPNDQDNKYTRGQVIALGGIEMTGAICLAAYAASRIGAGLISILSPCFHYKSSVNLNNIASIYRSYKPHIIVKENMSLLDLVKQAEMKGNVACIIGPGLGMQEHQVSQKIILNILARKVPIVLDADGLNVFQYNPEELFAALHENVILTPHTGEFKRLFKQTDATDLKSLQNAVDRLPSTLVLKGSKTLILQSGQEPIINQLAPAFLATGGSGDVLTGIIAGLLAQKMKPFQAAAAGVWVHSQCARVFGPGLVATDLADLIPQALQDLLGFDQQVG